MYGIKEYHNVLTGDFCKHAIEKFEAGGKWVPGVIGGGRVDTDVKRSDDLYITRHEEWAEEDGIFADSLSDPLNDYADTVLNECRQATDEMSDNGYAIQRTAPGGFYTWHNDFNVNKNNAPRIVTFIWYLNTIHKGGFTEFIDGTQIQPEEGKLLLFPATWTHMHRGVSPVDQTKYICTGWLHDNRYVR